MVFDFDLLRNFYRVMAGPDGHIELGLSAGTDASLDAVRKLHVSEVSRINNENTQRVDERYMGIPAAVQYSISHLNVVANLSPKIEAFRVASVIAVHSFNWITETNNDIVIARDAVPGTYVYNGEITHAHIINAATIILATKLNFFSSNHHTGQGRLSGFAKKAAVNLLNLSENETIEICSYIHSAGHWADSRAVFFDLSINGAIDVVRFHRTTVSRVSVSRDIEIRTVSYPAGTAKLAFCVAAGRRLVNSRLAPYIPWINHLNEIVAAANLVKANPLRYHIGSAYLTNNPRILDVDEVMSRYLGRLVTFVTVVYSRSTLAKAAVCKDAATSYDDYDDTFENLCRAYLDSINTPVAEIIEAITAGFVVGEPQDIAAVKNAFNAL